MTLPVRRISAKSSRFDFGLAELWGYHELLFWLGWRDIRIRYRQTLVGALWAVLQPLSMMIVFTLTLGVFARVPSEAMPYPVLVLSGLVPWTLLANALSNVSASLINNSALITKVYFPRLVVALSSMLGPLVDYMISLGVLVLLMLVLGVTPAWTLLALPLMGVVIVISVFGMGLWFAALNVRFRDVRFIVPFALQVGMFASPVVYPMQLVPERWMDLYVLNPAVVIIEGFRWLLMGQGSITAPMILSWAAFSVITLVTGLLFFRSEEKAFADTV